MERKGTSKTQKQFWILNETNPNSGAYNLFSVFKLSKPLNHEHLQIAVKIVIDRHEALRTSFEFVDNELFQYIKGPDETNISISEVNIDQIFSIDTIHPDIFIEVNRPFDMTKSPLCRFTLFNFKKNISVFSIVFHHIIVDVRSEGIFAKELSEAYNCLVKKQDVKLETVPYQYSDYINEINPWYLSDQYSAKLKELDLVCPDLNAVIKLPADNYDPDENNIDGCCVFFKIDQPLADKIKQFANENNINPYRVFLTAYAILLYRLSNQDKVYIGLPLTNRTRPVSKSTFGCFINALPLLVDFSTEKSSKGVLDEVIASLSRLLDYQEIPFPDLVTYNRHENNVAANPYFQTCFSFKPQMRLELGNIDAKPLKISKKDNQKEFDFYLTLYPEDDCFIGCVEYSVLLFKRQTIIRWIDIFKKVVISLMEYPDLSVNKIDILTDEDKRKLSEFNNTEVVLSDLLIQNFFENQVELTPFKTAVISGTRSLTYQELDDQSNQVANHLVSIGVIPGDIVGVCLERSVEMVISVLGILKAGCCFLPLDPSFPDDRISYMYEDSGAKVIISQSSIQEKFYQFPNALTLLTDSDTRGISKCSTQKPELNISTQSSAYIIYTSGSTGKPKGVWVHHESVVNLIESMSKEPGIKENDILLSVVTLSFDMSVFELFVPLSKGATVVIANSYDTTNGEALINLIDKNNVTMLQATPSLWNILLASGWKGKNDLRAFCGGEALTKNLVRQILPKVKEIWNCYGPTETTVYSTYFKVTDPDLPILVGRPINNTRVYILDKNNKQLPLGVIGEVCIGGLGVSKGYNNLPELTKEKFIRFENGDVIYKTGDLGRFLIDGNIELFGRIDNQIKLRGFRIEPGEIESHLLRLSGVKEAVVKTHWFDENDERLVAFLNVDQTFILNKEKIVRSLSQHLPNYMLPAHFQKSDGFPMLPNGKINKKALTVEIDESDRKNEIDLNLKEITPTELIIYNIWCEALKTKDISTKDNFFTVGGNSLLAINVYSKIESAFNVRLGLRVFFDSPRIKDLAEAIYILGLKSFGEITTDSNTRIISGEI
jgi:amino acid adenylation domain-containing protein